MKKLVVVITLLLITVFIITLTPQFPSWLTNFTTSKTTNNSTSYTSVDQSSPIPKLLLTIFADNLSAPRDLQFSQGGTLLVSIPSLSKVVALWGQKEGKAEYRRDVLTNLRKPHGLAFYQNLLFVAEETAVNRYKWDEETKTATWEKKLFDLPAGGRHVTRSLVVDNQGLLYVSIGSTCDVCIEKDPRLAAVIVSDIDGINPRVFAKGLRNAVFITLNPKTSQLWGTEMGRDNLGDDLPPDEINLIEESNDYGWPYCYGQQVYDVANDLGGTQNLCQSTTRPFFEIPAHSAPLGLKFVPDTERWQPWSNDLLVAYHGSWNRSLPIGYKIVRLNIEDNKVNQEETLFNFLSGATYTGRPVDLEFSSEGDLYISDDHKGVIYKVILEQN